MAVWLESGTEPSTTLDANLYQRRPTSDPESSTECFDQFDFGDHRKPPKRSGTYPFILSSPSEPHILKPGTAGNAYPATRKRRDVPPIPKRIVDTDSNWVGPHKIRHASTIESYKSASFDDTAVWDQKAILSLGTYLVQSEYVAPWCDFGLKAVSVCN